MNLLESIQLPKDLKNMSIIQLKQLAKEIRTFLIEKVHQNGGHLASNLGAVELSLALHRNFDFSKDRIIFDVSHQSYVHKILSGRIKEFNSLRQFNKMSGFTDPLESIYDVVKTGHAGTSISLGLGIQSGFEALNKNEKVVVFIGDASISNGVAFEALNHLGHLQKNLIIVLNDNQMSISKTVGALSHYLSRFISGKFFQAIKNDLKKLLKDIPFIGDSIHDTVDQVRRALKKNLIPNLFEELGVQYLGPVDGHQIEDLQSLIGNMADLDDGPVLLHAITKKGKGFAEAELNPQHFHGISPQNSIKKDSYTAVFGRKMLEIASVDPKVVVITAAMTDGTGLNELSAQYPKRYFDVGIAEEHAIAFAAGMSLSGLKPYVAIYSTFMQRAVDQLFQEVSLQKEVNPVFVMDRSGLVGEDGATHHGVFDIAYTRFLPRFVLAAPKDDEELEKMLDFSLNLDAPMVIRFAKGAYHHFNYCDEIELGKAEIILEDENAKLNIFAYGSMVSEAYSLKDRLAIPFNLINIRFAKPLDEATILSFAKKGLPIVTLEEHSLIGGVGEAINNLLVSKNVNAPVLNIGLEDRFYPHGKRRLILEDAGLSGDKLLKRIQEWL